MTIRDDPLLSPGDLVPVEFGPIRGTEQDGRRPTLVVSTNLMTARTRRVIVCPITRNVDPWVTKVFLPDGLGIRGAVLTDQVRSIDRRARVLRRIGSVPQHTLAEVRYQIGLLLGLQGDEPAA